MFLEKQNKIILEEREKTLVSIGLFEKEYSPDNRETWQYPEYDYIDGKRKYYKKVAIKVTDEEYQLILTTIKQVEEIKFKEEKEKRREQSKISHKMIKKWIPIFEKPKEETLFGDDKENVDNGKSKTAKSIRIVYYIFMVITFIGAIIIDFSEELNIFPIVFIGGVVEGIFVEGLTSILDYLAELTSIAKNGFKYDESNK